MVKVLFHAAEMVEDALFAFAVIAARYQGQWVFVRHRERSTWEIPGGHREPGEDIEATARRELYEETGATEFSIVPVCAYSVTKENGQRFGMFYFAEIAALGPLPALEIGEITLRGKLPDELTYPLVQPVLFQKVDESFKGASL